MMGSSVTSDITKGYRALLCMFTAFLVACSRARSRGLQFSSGHARGLTCSRIVETGINDKVFCLLSVIYVIYVYAFVEK